MSRKEAKLNKEFMEMRESLTGHELSGLEKAIKVYAIHENEIFNFTSQEVQDLLGISRTTYYRHRQTSYYQIVHDCYEEVKKRGQVLTVDKVVEVAEGLKARGVLETYGKEQTKGGRQ